MSDKPPILLNYRFGVLRPSDKAAEDALRAYSANDNLRAVITKASGKWSRIAFYWTMLGIAAENLEERFGIPGLSKYDLHKRLKKKLGLMRLVTFPSGETVEDYDSISFDNMPEHERAEFINRAMPLLAKWLGCSVEELTQAGKAA